jgi:hypothetical protein
MSELPRWIITHHSKWPGPGSDAGTKDKEKIRKAVFVFPNCGGKLHCVTWVRPLAKYSRRSTVKQTLLRETGMVEGEGRKTKGGSWLTKLEGWLGSTFNPQDSSGGEGSVVIHSHNGVDVAGVVASCGQSTSGHFCFHFQLSFPSA